MFDLFKRACQTYDLTIFFNSLGMMMRSMALETSKVIVLTGASSGIGEATARHLVRKGHKLFIGARRIDRLKALQAELSLEGLNVDVMALDVT